MKKNHIILAILFLILAGTSCTKVIDLKLGIDTGKLVIEANLTDIKGTQTVKITRNVPFSTPNSYPPVSGATVTITDTNGKSYPFTEGAAGIYSIDSFAGTYGDGYNLSVSADGKNYTATSVMPHLVSLDSLTEKKDNYSDKKDRKIITAHYHDPADIPNQYRFVMLVNGIEQNAIYADNDQINDGRFTGVDLYQGDIEIYPGDTVTVEMQCIDKNMFTYWSTLAQQQNSGQIGQVVPSDAPTNITPAVLGYFSAHTSQIKTIIVK